MEISRMETSDLPHPAPATPTMAAERIVALDFIRGIAVLGILFANITAYSHPVLAYLWPPALPGGGTAGDQAVWLFQFVFVDGKFRGLFTLLFGAGFYLFLERAWVRGAGRRLQARRLFWLALFGVAHFALLFVGDILFSYAIAGFIALPMVRWTARRQLYVGLCWYLLASASFAALTSSSALMEADASVRHQPGVPEQWRAMEADVLSQLARAGEARQVYSEGTYAEVVRYRLVDQSGMLAQAIFLVLVETVPLVLIGMALYRLDFFAGAYDRSIRRWCWIGLLGGAIASAALGLRTVAAGFPFYLTQFTSAAAALPRLPMLLGLAGLLVLASPVAARGWGGRRIVAAGRMAFSNYIGTSISMMLVFQGWAGGLFGQLSRVELLGLVLLGWVLMLAWSASWLARFRHGPLEWLWRCLTYGQIFDIRREPLATATNSH